MAIDPFPYLAGAVTVEPRNIGSGRVLAFRFGIAITSACIYKAVNASGLALDSGTGVLFSNRVLLTLRSLPDNSRVTVSLTGVNGSNELQPSASIGFLAGDVNNTTSVNSSDINGVKARSGQVTTATNFKFELNAPGAINSSDIAVVKAWPGLVLP